MVSKKHVIEIILVNEITSMVENEYPSYFKYFKEPKELMDSVPQSLGQEKFDAVVEFIESENFIFFSEELINDDSINDKDIAFYHIEAENDLPERYKNSEHIKYDNEYLIYNKASELVEEFVKNTFLEENQENVTFFAEQLMNGLDHIMTEEDRDSFIDNIIEETGFNRTVVLKIFEKYANEHARVQIKLNNLNEFEAYVSNLIIDNFIGREE